jgi:OFA family oxalate/formate antiporter-like MFS transporter
VAAGGSRNRVPDRWVIACAGVLVQLGLGSAYAWSVFRRPLSEEFGWSISTVTVTFSLFILTAGFASVLGGLWLQRSGPRPVLVASGLLYGGGVALASRSADALWLLYVSHGLVAGAGMGLGYIVPIAVLQRWFPDRRGLINGIAVSGISAGALIAAPIAGWLVARSGVLDAFLLLGLVYGAVIIGAGAVLRDPPRSGAASAPPAAQRAGDAEDLDLRGALGTWHWYALWATFFLSVAAGVGLISAAAPMAQELGGVSAGAAASITGALFAGDALGRLLWPWWSDTLGRRRVFVTIFCLQAGAFVMLSAAGSAAAFVLLAMLILFNYGGSSGTMAPFVVDLYGPTHVGSIYGLMLTAWGFGGVLGPLVIAAMRDATGDYSGALLVVAAIMALGVLLPVSLRGRPTALSPGEADVRSESSAGPSSD